MTTRIRTPPQNRSRVPAGLVQDPSEGPYGAPEPAAASPPELSLDLVLDRVPDRHILPDGCGGLGTHLSPPALTADRTWKTGSTFTWLRVRGPAGANVLGRQEGRASVRAEPPQMLETEVGGGDKPSYGRPEERGGAGGPSWVRDTNRGLHACGSAGCWASSGGAAGDGGRGQRQGGAVLGQSEEGQRRRLSS